MAEAAFVQRMTVAEYLSWERAELEKHEYHDGEIFAMAGGTPRHNFLSNAVGAELRAALRGKDCPTLSSDQRIAADNGSRFVYADAVAACGGVKTLEGTTDVLANPSIVVDVLSKSTEGYDRGDKWEAYQRLASMTDYLLISQAAVRIEHFQREVDGSWRYRVVEAGGRVALANGAFIEVDAIYQGAFDVAGD